MIGPVEWRRGLVAALLTVLLAGCAVRAPQPPEAGRTVAVGDWDAPPAPDAWAFSGRTSLRLADEGATASVSWVEDATTYRIDLRGVLGAGSLRIVGDEASVRLTTADGERYEAGSARELVRAITGYDLPVGFLRHWVTASPVPWLDGQVTLDERGRPRQLQQDGWEVTFDGYRTLDAHRLPGRIGVNHRDMAIRLVIGEWRLR
ncbi:lipoprotein insertase outer membrane protein LolB [Spiribacter sp. 221]|uniref:lipoprotein insertase outer membrane protein LolB n=1 Tax=Spiribacter onubensis TaxID=3122420 RepID=UPI00349F0AD6